LEIARHHLIPRLLVDHALAEESLSIDASVLELIIRDYTREAGVRQLNRELRRLCRALALQVVRSDAETQGRLVVTRENLAKYLGRPRFFSEVAERTAVPGVATGLAYTPTGGDILFIETS